MTGEIYPGDMSRGYNLRYYRTVKRTDEIKRTDPMDKVFAVFYPEWCFIGGDDNSNDDDNDDGNDDDNNDGNDA